ncbi:hypothetical protein ACAW74_05010 [Fibrella sp. WM1]|uniref:hypothetical protein n=1 Tax=Fibrella musci TaxID=3242485 RepID=UPI0035212B17
MFTFKIHFQEPCGLEGCTSFQCQLMATAIAMFEQEYPGCLLQFVTFTLNRPY